MITCSIVSKWDNKTTKHQIENTQDNSIYKENNCKPLQQTYGKAKFAKWRSDNIIYLKIKYKVDLTNLVKDIEIINSRKLRFFYSYILSLKKII